MKIENKIFILMLVVLAAVSIKTFIWVGYVFLTITIFACSWLFAILPIINFIKKNSLEESSSIQGTVDSLEEWVKKRKEREKQTSFPIILIILGVGLSIVTIGGLFRLMHWPGANINCIVGFAITTLTALFIILRKANMDSVKLAIISIFYAFLMSTTYMVKYQELYKYKDFSKLHNALLIGDGELANTEKAKLHDVHFDAETYNNLSKLEEKACDMAKNDPNATVLTIIEHNIYGDPEFVDSYEGIITTLRKINSSSNDSLKIYIVCPGNDSNTTGTIDEAFLKEYLPNHETIIVK